MTGQEQLAAYRDANSLTYVELAEVIGDARADLGSCAWATARAFVCGARRPTLKMATKIHAATGIALNSWIPDHVPTMTSPSDR